MHSDKHCDLGEELNIFQRNGKRNLSVAADHVCFQGSSSHSWALFITDTKQRQHEHAGALKESGKTVSAVENNRDFSGEVIVDRIADLMDEKKEKTKHGLKESLDEIGDVVEERDMIDFPNERILLAGVPEEG